MNNTPGNSLDRSLAPPRVALLILILVVATGLRILYIGHHSLWADEIASLQIACGHPLAQFDFPTDRIVRPGPKATSTLQARSVGDVIESLRRDTHPPLYHLVLRAWRSMFGDSDTPARALSTVCSLLGILLLFDTVRLLSGTTSALWAAAIMAVATPQIEYSQEVRGYMMLVMWTVASAWAVVRIEVLGPAPARAVLLATCLLAGMLTHYYAAATVVAIALYALVRLRGPSLRCAGGAIVVAGVIFVATCGPLLWDQRRNFHNNMTWIADARDGLVTRTLQRLAELPIRHFITPMKRSRWLAPLSVSFLLVPLLLLHRRRDVLLWSVLALSAIALPAAADLFNASQSLNRIRYTLAAGPAIFALVAILLADRQNWFRHAVPAAVVLACLMALPQAYAQPWKPDWRSFGREIAQHTGQRDVLIFYQHGPDDWYPPLLHAGITHYIGVDRPVLVLSGPPDEALRRELLDAPRLWLVTPEVAPPVARLFPGGRSAEAVAMPYVGQMVRIVLDDPAAR